MEMLFLNGQNIDALGKVSEIGRLMNSADKINAIANHRTPRNVKSEEMKWIIKSSLLQHC